MGPKSKFNFPTDPADYVSPSSFSAANNSVARVSQMVINQQLQIDGFKQEIKEQKRLILRYENSLKATQQSINLDKERADRQLELMERKITELKGGVRETRDKTLEPLAIFVGLFTFASISFQIFSNVGSFELWSSLLIIIAGVLTMFSGLVVHATSISLDIPKRRIVTGAYVGVGVFLTLVGAWLYYEGNKAVDQRYSQACVELKDSRNENKIYCQIRK